MFVDTYIAEQRLHTVAKEHNFSYPKVIHLSNVWKIGIVTGSC